MSESMIERLAKELVRAHVGGDASTWPMASERARDTYRGLARAAIEAMRKPTEAMLEAGAYDEYSGHTEMAADITWQAMIDAALSEKR